MEKYDAVIIGAGPGGAQCARELDDKGFKTLLIEKAKDFQENNFSSGGAPQALMQEFGLPDEIVGRFWNKMVVQSKNETCVWSDNHILGPILDFDKLRAFLTKNIKNFYLGCKYLSHTVFPDYIDVKLKKDVTEINVRTRFLIDATGTERKVLKQPEHRQMEATGIEFHIEVQKETFQEFDQSLHFFLAPHWMPQGYAWIFPMKENQLKVGVVRYYCDQSIVEHKPSYQYYLDKILAMCGSYRLLDRHGKTIHYTIGQKDQYCDGNVLALGDAISCINPLGCEGIRHAMVSGRIAAEEISKRLKGKTTSFSHYEKRMQDYFGNRWFFSEILMNQIYKTKTNERADRIVRSFKKMKTKQAMDLIFNYNYRWLARPLGYFALNYLCSLSDNHLEPSKSS